ncbi:MAG: gamma-glutamyl-phosphate reductase, partial [Chloroflexota bacterium]
MDHEEARLILREVATRAREAAGVLCRTPSPAKDRALGAIAAGLRSATARIVAENTWDTAAARAGGMAAALVDRLRLDPARVEAMACAVEDIARLPDPVGEVGETAIRPNGLRVSRMRVPLGVIGIVFEARPNVVGDAAALCLKSGNAMILRGGSEAARSNCVLGEVIAQALAATGLPEGC